MAIGLIGIVASISMMFLYPPATAETQKELLLSESVALSDQLQTQQKLSVMLSETVALNDKVTTSNPQHTIP